MRVMVLASGEADHTRAGAVAGEFHASDGAWRPCARSRLCSDDLRTRAGALPRPRSWPAGVSTRCCSVSRCAVARRSAAGAHRWALLVGRDVAAAESASARLKVPLPCRGSGR